MKKMRKSLGLSRLELPKKHLSFYSWSFDLHVSQILDHVDQ